MNVNELTDLIVKVTRSNKKQQYSRALADVINGEKGAPVFDAIDYVFNESDGESSMVIGKYIMGDVIKIGDKDGSIGYFPYYLLLSKEQYDKFGREVQCIKDGQCFYTEALDHDYLGIIPDDVREDNDYKDIVKDYYAWFVIIYPALFLYNNDETHSWHGVEQIIITYDGVQYKYDKNNVIVDKNESVSAQSFNLLNQEA